MCKNNTRKACVIKQYQIKLVTAIRLVRALKRERVCCSFPSPPWLQKSKDLKPGNEPRPYESMKSDNETWPP
jgi:hypothetical protein